MQKQVEVTVQLKFVVDESITNRDIDSEVSTVLEDALGFVNSDIISPDFDAAAVVDVLRVSVVPTEHLDLQQVDSECSGTVEKMVKFHHPNGLKNWYETHLEVCYYLCKTEDVEGSMAYRIRADQGRGRLYELSEMLTNKFENKYRGRVLPDYFEKIDNYLNEQDKLMVWNLTHTP